MVGLVAEPLVEPVAGLFGAYIMRSGSSVSEIGSDRVEVEFPALEPPIVEEDEEEEEEEVAALERGGVAGAGGAGLRSGGGSGGGRNCGDGRRQPSGHVRVGVGTAGHRRGAVRFGDGRGSPRVRWISTAPPAVTTAAASSVAT